MEAETLSGPNFSENQWDKSNPGGYNVDANGERINRNEPIAAKRRAGSLEKREGSVNDLSSEVGFDFHVSGNNLADCDGNAEVQSGSDGNSDDSDYLGVNDDVWDVDERNVVGENYDALSHGGCVSSKTVVPFER